MPLYDFLCKSCGHEFEALVRTGDTPSCPKCRSGELERLLSTFALNTEERHRAAVADSRKRQVRANRDKVIAEEEYRQKHDKE